MIQLVKKSRQLTKDKKSRQLTVYSRQKAKESWQPARLCRSPARYLFPPKDLLDKLAQAGSQQTKNLPCTEIKFRQIVIKRSCLPANSAKIQICCY